MSSLQSALSGHQSHPSALQQVSAAVTKGLCIDEEREFGPHKCVFAVCRARIRGFVFPGQAYWEGEASLRSQRGDDKTITKQVIIPSFKHVHTEACLFCLCWACAPLAIVVHNSYQVWQKRPIISTLANVFHHLAREFASNRPHHTPSQSRHPMALSTSRSKFCQKSSATSIPPRTYFRLPVLASSCATHF